MKKYFVMKEESQEILREFQDIAEAIEYLKELERQYNEEGWNDTLVLCQILDPRLAEKGV